jgi:hypothetical protein
MSTHWTKCGVTTAIVSLSLFCGRAIAEEFKTIDNAEVRRHSQENITYDFTEKIDGKSVVVVRSPNGTVKFSTRPAFLNDGSKIDGASKVLIEAERITFNAKIDGSSVVLVIVSKGGTIEINDKIDGMAQVFWCKASDDDPEPTLKTAVANPRGEAKYNQVTREEMERLIREHDLR